MNWKQLAITVCLTAGLLCSTVPYAPSAFADTSLKVAASGTTISASGIYSQSGTPIAGVPAFLKVTDDKNVVYHLDQIKTAPDGTYSFEWTMPALARSGVVYSVNLFI